MTLLCVSGHFVNAINTVAVYQAPLPMHAAHIRNASDRVPLPAPLTQSPTAGQSVDTILSCTERLRLKYAGN